ncbi:hypothetical protein E1161_23940 [Saccharopolyspora aridisoli]|uniref:Polysaccharide biosynthesis protein n=1 Tax=Saccharopolyspora aridisoli TaxID=2530385 RepID=A0A4R4UEE5_9PSEU|nr:hypothetical protein [Saccharopolyspora aridisoli]TDC88296.1 hypothetical protein E1161_23940 [Saccharopolyspora aridisoli]
MTGGEQSGAVALAVGTVLVGAAGYAFVALAGHLFVPSEAAAVSALYMVVNILGPGVFLALEQEASRRTAHAVALGRSLRESLVRTSIRGTGLLAAGLLALVACAPLLVEDALAGHSGLLAVAAANTALTAMMSLVRGVLAGLDDAGGYAASLGAEGIGRLLLVGSAWVAGPVPVTWYAATFAAGTGCSALIGGLFVVRRRRAMVRPSLGDAAVNAGSRPEMSGGLPSLAVATLLSYVIANLSVVIVTTRLHDAALAAAFAAGLLLTRMPMFVFSPVQAFLLTALTDAQARAERRRFRAAVRKGMAVALAFGAAGLLGVLGLGGWALRELFGTRVPLSTLTLVCLVGSTVLLMGAQVLHAALVARGRHREVAASWLAGAVVLVAVLASPAEPVAAAVAAQALAGLTVAVGMAWALSRSSTAPGTREPQRAPSAPWPPSTSDRAENPRGSFKPNSAQPR